jgi:hypothetical protein
MILHIFFMECIDRVNACIHLDALQNLVGQTFLWLRGYTSVGQAMLSDLVEQAGCLFYLLFLHLATRYWSPATSLKRKPYPELVNRFIHKSTDYPLIVQPESWDNIFNQTKFKIMTGLSLFLQTAVNITGYL